MKFYNLLMTLGAFTFSLSAYAGQGELEVYNVMSKKVESTNTIKSITYTADYVQIQAENGVSCSLPIDKMMPRYVESNPCAEGFQAPEYEQERGRIIERFSHARNYVVRCSFRDDRLIGYSFTGNTLYDGEPLLTHQALAFDLNSYPPPPPPREPNPLERLGRYLGRVLMKMK